MPLAKIEPNTIDRRMLQAYGGSAFVEPGNFLHRGTLEYVLGVIDSTLFGQEMYPSIQEKAAAVGWYIIQGHVFNDGNKRTGMMACAILLDLHGYSLLRERGDPEAEAMALGVAAGQHSLQAFTAWVTARTTDQ